MIPEILEADPGTAEAPAMDADTARQLRRRLDPLYKQTTEAVADAVCSLFSEPEETGTNRLFERLDALYEGITLAAIEAVNSVLAELAAPRAQETPEPAAEALQADPPEATPDGVHAQLPEEGESIAPRSVQEACAGHPGEGPGRPGECPRDETRVCRVCGAPFRVNPHHASEHRFCSAACRSKHRHRLKRASKAIPGDSGPGPAVLPDSVYVHLSEPTDAPDLRAEP